MLPDMSDVLIEWEQSVTLKTVTTTTVDFQEQRVVTPSPLLAVVQPADPERITVDQVDWSMRHYTVHSRSPIDVSQYIEYHGVDYKVIQLLAYGDYGYWEVVIEEMKEALE